jgi:hypothetical protein
MVTISRDGTKVKGINAYRTRLQLVNPQKSILITGDSVTLNMDIAIDSVKEFYP